MKLRRTEPTDRPGLVRTVRIDRRVDQLVARANPGDIAVIDVIDLDRATAERLVNAGVSAVVNAASSCSGRFPVNGAQTLLEAGVVLVDDVGGEVFSRVRDGDTIRLDGPAVYAAGERVVEGDLQSDESVAGDNAAARLGMHERLGALVADAARVLGSDDGRLLEGDAFPPLATTLRDRTVVVITSGTTPDELVIAKRLVRSRDALVVAVGPGADLARASRLRPDLVVVGRSALTRDGFGKAREVLVLDAVELDPPVPTGTPRAHAAAVGSADDTAVLLAHTRGAALVVTFGTDETLGGLLDRSAAAGSIPFVTRLRDGGRHLCGAGAAVLLGRRHRVRTAFVSLVAVLALVAAAAGGAAVVDARSDDSAPVAGAAPAVADPTTTGGEFAAVAAPALVADRLQGHVATVVVLPGAGPTDGITKLLRRSGASLVGPVVIQEPYLDPSRSRVLRDLALQLSPAALRTALAAQPASTTPAAQLDQILASSLAVRSVSTVGGTDAALGTLLTGLGRLDALTPPAAGARAGDLVVVVAPARSDAASTARTSALVSAFARQGKAVVVVATGDGSGAADAQGLVSAIRAATPVANVATVDHGAGTTGEVSTVLALESILDGGRGGDYGTSAGADSILPPVETTSS